MGSLRAPACSESPGLRFRQYPQWCVSETPYHCTVAEQASAIMQATQGTAAQIGHRSIAQVSYQ